jgi:N-acetylmuramic acid 6-phosphate etherase
MIQLGKVEGNKMIEMQLTNKKLWHRAVKILVQELDIEAAEALILLQKHTSIKKAISAFRQ